MLLVCCTDLGVFTDCERLFKDEEHSFADLGFRTRNFWSVGIGTGLLSMEFP